MENNNQPMPFRQHLSEPVGPALKAAFSEYIDQRTSLGIKKYNEPLHSFNGRDCVEDAIEEILDFTQYQQQRIMELKTAISKAREEADRWRREYELLLGTRGVDREVVKDLLYKIDCTDAHACLWGSTEYKQAALAVGKTDCCENSQAGLADRTRAADSPTGLANWPHDHDHLEEKAD